MGSPRIALWAACTLVASFVSVEARADLPPPPGQTRVDYTFRVTGSVRDVVMVAFPIYASGGKHALELELEKEVRPVQGWTPGIYAIRASDFAEVKDSTDEATVRKVLESKGHACVKKVPRVFTVPSSTKVTSMLDVFSVRATPESCQATLDKTVYRGANREQGEGTVDSTGRRVPPAPFGSELPTIGDGSLVPTGGSSSPPSSSTSERPSDGGAPQQARGGCAGCSLPSPAASPSLAHVLLALVAAALAAWRRGSAAKAGA